MIDEKYLDTVVHCLDSAISKDTVREIVKKLDEMDILHNKCCRDLYIKHIYVQGRITGKKKQEMLDRLSSEFPSISYDTVGYIINHSKIRKERLASA
jgi:hypothetical protein